MNLDSLMRKSQLLLLCTFATSLVIADDDVVSTITDDVATLNMTTVSGARSVIIREEAAQQLVTPSIATKTPLNGESRDKLLPSVDSISGAEIRTFQRYGLEDILSHSAGVSVVQTGQSGSQTSLFIRGMESNHTVVMLNGRRLPPGLAGIYQLEYLDTSTLESVQILRGGASSLYGADALAGAIDLRSADARYVDANTVSSYAEGGSFSTFRTGHKVTLRDGPVGIAFDASFVDTQNDRPMSDFDNGVVRGNVAIKIADGVYFDVLGYVQDSTLEVAGSSLSPAFPSNQLNKNKSGLFSPRFSIERDEWDFSVFYSYTTNELEATMAPFFGDNLLDQTGHETEAQFNYRGVEGAVLTLGGGNYDYSFERTPIIPGLFNPAANFSYNYSSIYAQADVDLPANFNVLASGRYDDHDSFESKGTYSAQLSHRIDKTGTMLFGKIATGYKAPSGQDFIYLDPSVLPTSLDPEESQTWELGFRQQLCDDRGSVSITYFQADIENLVDSTFDLTTFTSFPAIVDTKTSGVEIEFRAAPCDYLEVYANYTNLDAKVVDGSYFQTYNPGDRLVRRPRHTFNAGAVTHGDGWKAGAEISGAYDRPDNKAPLTGNMLFVDDYTVARIFGSYEVCDNVEIYGRVENAFDTSFEQTAGFKAAGLGAFAGVRILLGQ